MTACVPTSEGYWASNLVFFVIKFRLLRRWLLTMTTNWISHWEYPLQAICEFSCHPEQGEGPAGNS